MRTNGLRGPALRRVILLLGAAACGAALLASCSNNNHDTPADEASSDSNIKATWVEIGDQNQIIARAVSSYSDCPQISIDGTTTRMQLRVAPGTAPLRATASAPEDSKPSEFPVRVCEAQLAADAKTASIGSHMLPLPKADPQRIVIIGDTGCRMKKSSNTFQACNDAAQWPFAQVAAAAAAMKPDLVLHVGDYHYRENACPDDITGCKDSPWGYGWDVWDADLFTPAASLMTAAPWIVVRGNHEECARGGQGWFRFLDPAAFDSERSCDDASNDNDANYSYPYAVKLGSDTQFIVFDSAKTTGKALKPTDAAFVTYQQQFQKVATLAATPGVTSIFTNHHPILAFAPLAGAPPAPGDQALQSVMSSLNATAYYPPGVQLALHGHVHDFQAIDFSTGQPATIVAGIAGDNLDVNLPDPLPDSSVPAEGTVIDAITHTSTYGFLLMERTSGSAAWTFKAYSVGGALLTTCGFSAGKISCDKSGFINPPA